MTGEQESYFSTQKTAAVFMLFLQHPVTLQCQQHPRAQEPPKSLHPLLRHAGGLGLPGTTRGCTDQRASREWCGIRPPQSKPTALGAASTASTGLVKPGGPRRPPEPLREDTSVAARSAQPTLTGQRAPGGIRLRLDVLAGPWPTPSSWTPLASCVRQRNDAPSYCK